MLLKSICVALLIIFTAAPLAAQPPEEEITASALKAGDRCQLANPLPVITEEESAKLTLSKSTVLEVIEIQHSWVSVRAGELTGWARTIALHAYCRLMLPEAQTAAPQVSVRGMDTPDLGANVAPTAAQPGPAQTTAPAAGDHGASAPVAEQSTTPSTDSGASDGPGFKLPDFSLPAVALPNLVMPGTSQAAEPETAPDTSVETTTPASARAPEAAAIPGQLNEAAPATTTTPETTVPGGTVPDATTPPTTPNAESSGPAPFTMPSTSATPTGSAGQTTTASASTPAVEKVCGPEHPDACQVPCEQGQAEACFIWAEHLQSVSDAALAMSDTTAAQAEGAYHAACDGGHGLACRRLADLAVDEDDLAAAAELYTKACRVGDGLGCARLGLFMREGRAGEKNPEGAAVAYRRGCELGSPQSCAGLGALMMRGQGVSRSLAMAFALFSKACSAGTEDGAEGCSHLGYLYESGQGTNRDLHRARTAYTTACGFGDDYACSRLEAMGVPMQKAATQEVHVINMQMDNP